MPSEYKVAFLDSYQDAKLHERYADFSTLPGNVKVDSFQDHLTDEGEIASRLQSYQIIVCMRERTPFQKSLLEKLPNLKLLITTGPMNASIDGKACKELGVKFAGSAFNPSLLLSTRELSWTLILACAKNLLRENASLKEGNWQVTVGGDLLNKTLGLYGLGNIGKGMIPVAKAFGMNVVAWSQHLTEDAAKEAGVEKADSLEDLAKRSDFLSVHQKLSDRSRGAIDAKVLAALGPKSYLINTSRGPIVNEKDLIDALEKRTVAGAGLDVFDMEPLEKDSPLRKLDNIVATPHIGYGTDSVYSSFYPSIVENITAFVKENKVLREIEV